MLDRTRRATVPKHSPHHVRSGHRPFRRPDLITGHALPVLTLDTGEVLIAVGTAGVGVWDADIREGLYAPRKPHFPLVLGFDGAGVVAAVGAEVCWLRVGDEVYSYSWQNPKGGFYAEHVVVAADKVAPSEAARPAACRRDSHHRLTRFKASMMRSH